MEVEKLNFKNIQKILIPTDGSECSMHAAELGVSIAKMLSAQITVVFVVDEVVLNQFSKATESGVKQDLKEDGQRYINNVLGLAKSEGVQASSMIAEGKPFEQIVELAIKLGIDLVVMGTFGRRGADRILIGSVAQKVIEYSSCPVSSYKVKVAIKGMSEKLEEDYQNFNKKIEQLAADEIKKVSEKANAIKEESIKVGQTLEVSLNKKENAGEKD